MKVHGFPVCHYSGQVQTPMAGSVDVDNEALALQLPKRFCLTVVRKGIAGEFDVWATRSTNKISVVREVYPMWEEITWLRFGGAVFVNLNKNMLEEYTDDDDRLKHAWGTWCNRDTCRNAVFVSFVTPQEYADDCGMEALMQLLSVDNNAVSNIDELKQRIADCACRRNTHVLLKFKDFTMVADAKAFESRQNV